jgi:hypothetical protein
LLIQQVLFTFAKALEECLTVNGLHLAAFQVVVTPVEHFACLRKLGNVPGNGVLKKLVRRKPGFDRQLVNLGLQFWGEMYFHGFKNKGKRAALLCVGNFVEKLIHDLLSEPKICVLHAFKSVRKIQKMALRRPTENAERPRDLKSFSPRGDDAFLVIHQQ